MNILPLGIDLDPAFVTMIGLIVLSILLGGWALARLCTRELPEISRQVRQHYGTQPAK